MIEIIHRQGALLTWTQRTGNSKLHLYLTWDSRYNGKGACKSCCISVIFNANVVGTQRRIGQIKGGIRDRCIEPVDS